MERKLFVPIIVFLLLISLVMAAPPVKVDQVSITADVGLQIRVPSQFYIKQNSNFEFHIHIFNITNGYPITSATCFFHLYNNSGNHFYTANTSTIENNFDFSFDIGGGNFSNLGIYSYIAQCNSSGMGGFYASNFDVTSNGKPIQDQDTTLYAVIVLIPLILVLFFLIVSWILPPEKYWALKIGLILLGFSFIFVAYQFSIAALNEFETYGILYDTVIGNMTIYGYIYWIIMAVFIITFIYDVFMIFNDKKQKTGDYKDE